MQPHIPVPVKHQNFLKVQQFNGPTQGIDSMAITAIIGNQVHDQLYILVLMQLLKYEQALSS